MWHQDACLSKAQARHRAEKSLWFEEARRAKKIMYPDGRNMDARHVQRHLCRPWSHGIKHQVGCEHGQRRGPPHRASMIDREEGIRDKGAAFTDWIDMPEKDRMQQDAPKIFPGVLPQTFQASSGVAIKIQERPDADGARQWLASPREERGRAVAGGRRRALRGLRHLHADGPVQLRRRWTTTKNAADSWRVAAEEMRKAEQRLNRWTLPRNNSYTRALQHLKTWSS